ncbi:MAG: peptide chain release factor 1 [Planctomycetaceae bacterium]|jgi:peptide chain release factor 1|nr:peptide chain release factor 1 [Planctomycetaceae bacterium]MDP7275413.1 peptide chain release factor 1 [Planctomycetaceae bacterium]
MLFPSLQAKLKRFEELEAQLVDPEVLADVGRMVAVQREYGGLTKVAVPVREFNELQENIETAQQMLSDESDPEAKAYAEEELAELLVESETQQAALEELLATGDAISRGSLIMEIRAGTGGDEAALFVRDLLEMYQRLVERRGWKSELIDSSPTELGGLKDVTLSISGDGAFLQLQFESGGHRVQRVPETEAQGRIHTSAATVAVLPEANDVEIEIKADDLRVDTFFASGPGGQKVNKTASAIRITHIPTNTVVQCQDEKSQHKNKAKAMRVLRSRLLEAREQKLHAERADKRRTLIGSGDRSQRVRTYNFPQNRLTDHRIGLSLYKLDQIMQGSLDTVIDALLEFDRQERLQGGSTS